MYNQFSVLSNKQELIMQTTNIVSETTLEPKTKVTGKVLKITLAGALVDIGQSLPGVVHISQLSKDAVNKVEDVLKEGQEVEAWVRRIKKDRIELTMIEPLGLE
jgi:ribosomal protein S1